MHPVTLLGPQRHPIVKEIIKPYNFRNPLAIITAGWQEREKEVEELDTHIDHANVHLELHRRSEEVFDSEPEYYQAYRERQNCLRRAQKLYRIQLGGLLERSRQLIRLTENDEMAKSNAEISLRLIRQLDKFHRRRIHQIQREFQNEWALQKVPTLEKHCAEIQELMAQCDGLCIAGGHVVVLRNRLRMFGLDKLSLSHLPVFAWSAGAMVLTKHIVLFHDSPPQGPGNPEILERGIALVPQVVALPHASKRLRLEDPARVAIFAKRFRKSRCIVLDPGCGVVWRNGSIEPLNETKMLNENGFLELVR